MTIEKIDVNVCSPGRNFVTLKIVTGDGVIGWGDATLNGRELSVAAYLSEHLASDADRPRRRPHRGHLAVPVPGRLLAARAGHHGRHRRRRHGAVGHQGQEGRHAALPVARRREPRPHRVYGHASGRDYAALKDAISGYLDAGYTAVRVQTGVPGLGQIYGVATNKPGTRYDYEPAHRAADGSAATAPIEEIWDTRAYLRHMPGVFAKIREDFGTGLRLLHDGHHRMTPIEAARFAKDVEPYDLFWLEDCTPGEDQAALRLVRQHSTTPLAIGEVFNSVYDYQTLITERLIDYVRSAVTHTGGITAMKKLLDFAGIYGIKSGMHGPTDISPVGMAAALHLDLAIHNFGIQEYMPHSDTTLEVFRTSYTFDRGYLHPGETPGLGVELDEKAAGGIRVHRRVPAGEPAAGRDHP